MHDIRWIRENPQAFDDGLNKRGLPPLAESLIALDAQRREGKTRLQALQAERNEVAKSIGQLKGQGKHEEAEAALKRAGEIKEEMARLEGPSEEEEKLTGVLESLPNLPAADVPFGTDESGNVEIRHWGHPKESGFVPREHFELGETLGQMDFETAAKMSGSRFVLLSGGLARLERALANFMLDLQTCEFGYTEVAPPFLVRDNALYGTGQLPKFEEDLFSTSKKTGHLLALGKALEFFNIGADHILLSQEETAKVWNKAAEIHAETEKLYLIPTAEVPLTNIVAGEILGEGDLPRRYTALTPCFRSEAGSAGRDTRGMIRQHQFSKVELVSIVRPEDSEAEHERMLGCAEEVLKRLELPFRTMLLCTGDMGFSAKKTYDIEVWLPGQGQYREISSCSNCGDFQARRMQARYRPETGKDTQFLHTLNGSGLAVGRTLIAVMENYQQQGGSIAVPDILKPYMGGIEVIGA